MVLRALMFKKELDEKRAALNALESEADFEKREAELATAIEEAETEEEKAAVEDAISTFEAEKEECERKKQDLNTEISELEDKLAEEERKNNVPEEKPKAPEEIRKDEPTMDEKEKIVMERRAFANFVRGIETRDDDYNMTQGNNGAVIPKSIAQEIITKVRNICPVFEQATRYNIKGNLEVPYYPADSSHAINAAYSDEMAELTAASGDFGTVELTGYVAGALAKISKKLVNNTDIDIVPFIVDQMAEEFAAFYEGEMINGTSGKATGMLAGITQTVTATAKTYVTVDDLINVQDQIPDALQANCCWIMSPKTRTAIRELKDKNERYILNNDVTNGFVGTLLGKPVYVSDNMPEMGTSGKMAVVYGDLSGVGLKVAEDLEIQPLYEKFATQHAIGVVGWTEFDCKVVNAQKLAVIKMASSDPTA